MIDVKPYYCPRCGRSYTTNECFRSGYAIYCKSCPNQPLSINGTVWLMVAATLGIAYLLPWVYSTKFEYGLIQYVLLAAIVFIASLGIIKIAQKRARRKKSSAEEQEEEVPEQIRVSSENVRFSWQDKPDADSDSAEANGNND